MDQQNQSHQNNVSAAVAAVAPNPVNMSPSEIASVLKQFQSRMEGLEGRFSTLQPLATSLTTAVKLTLERAPDRNNYGSFSLSGPESLDNDKNDTTKLVKEDIITEKIPGKRPISFIIKLNITLFFFKKILGCLIEAENYTSRHSRNRAKRNTPSKWGALAKSVLEEVRKNHEESSTEALSTPPALDTPAITEKKENDTTTALPPIITSTGLSSAPTSAITPDQQLAEKKNHEQKNEQSMIVVKVESPPVDKNPNPVAASPTSPAASTAASTAATATSPSSTKPLISPTAAAKAEDAEVSLSPLARMKNQIKQHIIFLAGGPDPHAKVHSSTAELNGPVDATKVTNWKLTDSGFHPDSFFIHRWDFMMSCKYYKTKSNTEYLELNIFYSKSDIY